ncbi:Uncharacterised protein [Vibrio cholerae]|nr:Uncharacterised protein [Vibrio cholerae]
MAVANSIPQPINIEPNSLFILDQYCFTQQGGL